MHRSQHLSGELFKSLAGVDLQHVPYKGSGPAIQDVIAGHVPLMFDTTVVASPHIQSGKLRALAVTSTRRVRSLAGVPTMVEAGVPGYEIGAAVRAGGLGGRCGAGRAGRGKPRRFALRAALQ